MKTVCFGLLWTIWTEPACFPFLLVDENNQFSLVFATLPKLSGNSVFYLVSMNVAAIGENTLF